MHMINGMDLKIILWQNFSDYNKIRSLALSANYRIQIRIPLESKIM